MRLESELLPRFNLATMSGVHGGRRTQTFYRLRLWLTADAAAPTLRWYLLQYTAGDEQVTDASTQSRPVPFTLRRYLPQGAQEADAKTSSKAQTPDVQTPDVQTPAPISFPATDWQDLPATLREAGFHLHACGSCIFWRKTTTGTDKDAPRGRCTWAGESIAIAVQPAQEFVEPLIEQSALAPGCAHWQKADTLGKECTDTNTDNSTAESSKAAADATPDTNQLPAHLIAARGGFWTRLLNRLLPKKHDDRLRQETRLVIERSGVGAGTEPCIACHGLLANLGALVVESPEGDPQTYSVWRCRACRSTFLNRWVDRWVRTDTLETDETIFRITPGEAAQVLTLIGQIPGADHPQKREERVPQREQLETLAASSDRMSHEIKQGR